MAKLTSEKRNALPGKSFIFPASEPIRSLTKVTLGML